MTPDSGTNYDPHAPLELFPRMILPPSSELEAYFLGGSSQLTDITSVMEPSFGDLEASASSRNREGALCGIRLTGMRHTRRTEVRSGEVRDVSLLYLVLMCRSWRTVTQVRISVQ